ncbi:hypothetical protein VTH82DRAFT_125 [Thermothelomyces myriococcoides]
MFNYQNSVVYDKRDAVERQLSRAKQRAPALLQGHVNMAHRVSPASANVLDRLTPTVYQGTSLRKLARRQPSSSNNSLSPALPQNSSR